MANDPTVKAGSWGARTVEKIVRLTEYALRHELPVFWLIDSAGARITDQVELFPDVVYGAYSDREFISLCRSALEEAPGFVNERRKGYGAGAAWSTRAGEVVRILSTAGLL